MCPSDKGPEANPSEDTEASLLLNINPNVPNSHHGITELLSHPWEVGTVVMAILHVTKLGLHC